LPATAAKAFLAKRIAATLPQIVSSPSCCRQVITQKTDVTAEPSLAAEPNSLRISERRRRTGRKGSVMNETELIELVCLARAGNREAFDQLVQRTESMVFAVVLRRLRNRSEALEVTQDVFIQVLRKLGQLREPERFGGWLRRIAVRLAINRAVRRPREVLGDNALLGGMRAETVNPFERVIASENAACVRECMNGLRDLDRRTLVAFYFEGRSLQEMSAEFDSPVGTIKRRLHTARNRLRDKLSDLQLVG
jgi:RNA polymerase sigma-70 factor (ECF subfamily)